MTRCKICKKARTKYYAICHKAWAEYDAVEKSHEQNHKAKT